ncbi:shikimate kinase [Ponticaulis sp.]|uniref:shikimate kinase n=1 Tax=Ponticaulis sp. TaxID=2020902 RepID=UPI000B647882|nr:shikimate kinase [Ponticaulis sp.]MAI90960.1 shikimate kinase [Ponticaulis sp.]OUX98301.1 MAG: shikimate kinase [Hyphomonadaceae bacterium TMED5]
MTTDTKESVAKVANGKTIALVGLMGAGKSSVGRRVAEALSLPFYDSDEQIEQAAGLSVTDIFSVHGEPEFRRGEQRVIERLLEGPQHVMATGGGAFMNPDIRKALKENAVTIWLRADLETLWRRVSRKEGRPLLKTENPKQKLRDLLELRNPVYAEADIVIDSRDGPHINAVSAILAALKEVA